MQFDHKRHVASVAACVVLSLCMGQEACEPQEPEAFCASAFVYEGDFFWPETDPHLCDAGLPFHISGRLTVQSEAADLTGLSCVCEVGGYVSISGTALTTLEGLENLTRVGEELIIGYNDALNDLEGLEGLTVVGKHLSIWHHDTLVSLDGLSGLTEVGGAMQIQYNDQLSDVAALRHLDKIDYDVSIIENPALPNCRAEALVYEDIGEENIRGYINIWGNSDTCPGE